MSQLRKYCGVGMRYAGKAEGGFEVKVPPSMRTVPTPAEIAGIQTGDVVTGITSDGTHYENPDRIDSKILRGPLHSTVEISVRRGSEERTVTLTRDFIVSGELNGPLIDNTTLENVPEAVNSSCELMISQDTSHGLPASLQRISNKEHSPS